MCSDLTFDPSFKVKRGYPNLEVLIACLLLVVQVWDGKPTYRKSVAGNLLMWSDLTLDPLLQGRMRIAKLKGAYNLLIIGPRGLQYDTNLQEVMGWESSDVFGFDLGPLLQSQTMVHWLW